MKPYTMNCFLKDLAKAGVSQGKSTPISKTCGELNLISTDLSPGVERVFEIAKGYKAKKAMLRFHHFLPAIFQCVHEDIEQIGFTIEEAEWLRKPELWNVKLTRDTSKGFFNHPHSSSQLRRFLKLADDAAIIGHTMPGYYDTYLIGGRCQLKLIHLLKAISWWQPRSTISPPWRDIDVRPINQHFRETIYEHKDLERVAYLDIKHDNAIQFRDYLYHGSWIKLAEHCRIFNINPLLCREKLIQGALLDGKREPAKNIPRIESGTNPEEIAAFCEIFGLEGPEYLKFLSP